MQDAQQLAAFGAALRAARGGGVAVLRVGRYVTVVDGLEDADPEIMAGAVARDLKRLGS